MTATENKADLATLCADLGLSLQCSAPIGGVDDSGERAWPHIAYAVTLVKDGKAFWSGPYKLGVGHVKFPKRFDEYPPLLSNDQISALNTLRNNPGAQLKDKQLWASVAAKLAIAQKVAPKPADVVHSLISDGSAYFEWQSFEQWADEFGYNTDSRKAEETYRACDAIGRALVRGLGRETVEKLREAAQDY